MQLRSEASSRLKTRASILRLEFTMNKNRLEKSSPLSITGLFRFRATRGLIALWLTIACTGPLVGQQPASIPEEIEWTWEVRPSHPNAQLPNVLLLGDSISRNYFSQVTRDLDGVANVYLMASSTSVGDPRLAHQMTEFSAMEKVRFRVVHFNNGMHGWGYSEAQYQAAFPQFLHDVRSLLDKGGASIWANTTPVRADAANGATNARVDARNAIAETIVKAAGIPMDDQHSLMAGHRDLYQDDVHFNTAGANIQGDQAASAIRSALQPVPK
jgi:hypothetical protein